MRVEAYFFDLNSCNNGFAKLTKPESERGADKTSRAHIPFRERRTCTVAEAIAAVPMGRTKCYELIKRGEVKVIKVGSATRVIIETLPGYGPQS